MLALPKWLTDIKKLFGSADGKVLGRVAGAWVFVSSFAPSAHNSSHATGGSDELAPEDIGAAASGHDHDAAYAAKSTEHSHGNISTLGKIGESGGEPTWDGGAWPGGGASEQQILSEPTLIGVLPTSSLTGWQVTSGAWATDGADIVLTSDVANGFRRNQYTSYKWTDVAFRRIIAFEMLYQSSNIGSPAAGVGVSTLQATVPTSGSNNGYLVVRFGASSTGVTSIAIENDGQNYLGGVTFTTPLSLDAWHTYVVEILPHCVRICVDGSFKWTFPFSSPYVYNSGLYGNPYLMSWLTIVGTVVKFRNIKMLEQTLPALEF